MKDFSEGHFAPLELSRIHPFLEWAWICMKVTPSGDCAARKKLKRQLKWDFCCGSIKYNPG